MRADLRKQPACQTLGRINIYNKQNRVSSNSTFALCLWLLSVLTLTSCTDHKPPLPELALLRTEDYEVIAVRSKPFEVSNDWEEPIRGRLGGGALVAGQATGQCIVQCTSEPDPFSMVVCLVLTPIATVAGAIYGAATGHSEEEVTQAVTALKEAITAATPVTGVEQAVMTRLRTTGDGRMQWRTLSQSELNLSVEELAELGIDAVLELRVSPIDLAMFGRIDPDAALVLAVRAELIDTNSGSASVGASWAYEGTHYNYFDMAENEARLLRESIQQSYDKIAQVIVADLI